MIAALAEELAAVPLTVPNQVNAFHAASIWVIRNYELPLPINKLFSNDILALHRPRGQSAVSL